MTSMDRTPDYTILLTPDTRQDSYRITGRIIELRQDVRHGFASSTNPAYEHLEVSDYTYTYDNQRRPITTWELSYAQPYRVTLREAEAMVKTLRRLERTLEHDNDTYGRPSTYGQYVQRVCAALKIPRMAWYTQVGGLKLTSPYIGAAQIDRLVDAWVTQAA